LAAFACKILNVFCPASSTFILFQAGDLARPFLSLSLITVRNVMPRMSRFRGFELRHFESSSPTSPYLWGAGDRGSWPPGVGSSLRKDKGGGVVGGDPRLIVRGAEHKKPGQLVSHGKPPDCLKIFKNQSSISIFVNKHRQLSFLSSHQLTSRCIKNKRIKSIFI
jgi:hypothetical protein